MDLESKPKLTGRGGPGRGQGRKAKEVPSVSVTFRMSPAQKEHLRRLGGSMWVRAQIDKAPWEASALPSASATAPAKAQEPAEPRSYKTLDGSTIYMPKQIPCEPLDLPDDPDRPF